MSQTLSKSDRLLIYREALALYKSNWEMVGGTDSYRIQGDTACLGLCWVIHEACRRLGYDIGYRDLKKTVFPEWFSYKPKTGWKQNYDFWWTVSVKNGGYARRVDLLRRLAEGKSKGE